MLTLWVACEAPKSTVSEASETQAPLSIPGLRARDYESTLTFEKEVMGDSVVSGDLYSYYSDSLKIYALVNTPSSEKPEDGYPVVIFGHGFHPEPKKYGVSTSLGVDWRPGDYYRGVPESYARAGYLTVTPDYRGHNVSDGFQFTQSPFYSNYYTIDVLHLIKALSTLENINSAKIYYVCHSLGGDVGLRALLVTNKIKAASLWSSVLGDIWQQSLFYGRLQEDNPGYVDNQQMKQFSSWYTDGAKNLPYPYDIESGDPSSFLEELKTPVIVQHALGDRSVPYLWSEGFVTKLYQLGKKFELYAYEGNDHLFKGSVRAEAVERDITFFKKY